MDSDNYSPEYTDLQTPSTVSSNDSAIELQRSVCKVCGDVGIGFNFGVRTCESCKAFFRRNANRPHDLKCAFANACNITKTTRKYCPKCRLYKCFEMGMRKELILSEEDKLQKRFRKRKSQDFDDFVPSAFCASFPSFDLENAFKDYHTLVYSCNAELTSQVDSAQELFDKNKLLDFVCQRSIISDFKYRNQRLDLEAGNEWGFNQIEMFKFDELRRTSADLLPRQFQHTETVPNLLEGFKGVEITITNLIKLVKQWAAFRILNIDEQISLLKLVLVEMFFVFNIAHFSPMEPPGIYVYNEERSTRIKLDSTLIIPISSVQAHDLIVKLYNKAMKLIENDMTLINLMIALILFRPREFPDRRSFLENEYLIYLFILNEHLSRQCSNSVEAKTKFLAVLALLEEFLTLARVFLAVLDKVDSSQITYFIKEVFNL